MDVEEIIQVIVDNGRIEDMHELSDMLEDTIEILQKYDPDCYKQYAMQLYKMAYGNKLPDEIKKQWVENMKPLSRWNIEETQEIYSRYGVNMPLYSFYVIMNLLYSDMKNSLKEINSEEDVSRYVQASHDWYYDEDAKNTEEAKLSLYWEYIVN